MPKKETIQKAIQIFKQHHGWLRTGQAVHLGISPRTLYALRDAGKIIQLSRGVYRLADQPISQYQDLLVVAQRVSKGVICLLSALSFHGLTMQIPHQVYLALPNHAEKPRLDYPPLRLVWLSDRAYQAGIEEHLIEGLPVRIYSPEKSVADAFKFRNKTGLDVALEALKCYRQSDDFNVEKLLSMAQMDRVEKIIRPYLEVLV
ncbi:MAG: type IV toxin-antitoxin system AbiEi family antitoxin domain-containing protein [Chloroflexi bacterium]|nr:type IV toxin-antitoxin system AbiEi family antitoxin domain-containing protein [Chloroflexota bacterium]